MPALDVKRIDELEKKVAKLEKMVADLYEHLNVDYIEE